MLHNRAPWSTLNRTSSSSCASWTLNLGSSCASHGPASNVQQLRILGPRAAKIKSGPAAIGSIYQPQNPKFKRLGARPIYVWLRSQELSSTEIFT